LLAVVRVSVVLKFLHFGFILGLETIPTQEGAVRIMRVSWFLEGFV
jgi:hypothetical protein